MEIALAVKEVFEGAIMLNLYPRFVPLLLLGQTLWYLSPSTSWALFNPQEMAGNDFPRGFFELEFEILTRALDEENKPIYRCTLFFFVQ